MKLKCKTGVTGQAMVEFLIVLPVMLLLVLGILQFALIYQAKITLNYAAFETARAGSLNNGNRDAMNLAFASNMAPLYTTSYYTFSSGNCSNNFRPLATNNLGGRQVMDTNLAPATNANLNNFNPDDVICARQRVQRQITNGDVNITVVNPSTASFSDYGIKIDGKETIPNDNLMYRNARISNSSTARQTIQDANLLKVHIGYCYELMVPFVNRIIWMMHRFGPGAAIPPGFPQVNTNTFFGPAPGGSFAQTCINNPSYTGRAIVLYAQSIVRMQSPAIQCEIIDPDSC
jgi:Flp pilus assembly protein TadG